MSELQRIARQYQRFSKTNHPNVEKVDPRGDVLNRAREIYEDFEYKKGNEVDYPRKWAQSYATFEAAVAKIMNDTEPEGQPGPSTPSETTDTELTSQPTSPISEAFESPRTSSPETVIESPTSKGKAPISTITVPDNQPGPSTSQPIPPAIEGVPDDQPRPSTSQPTNPQPPSPHLTDHPANDDYVFDSADETFEDDYQYGTDDDEGSVDAIPIRRRRVDGHIYIKVYDPEISWAKLTEFRVEGRTPVRGSMVISAPSRNAVLKYALLRREYIVKCADVGIKWSELETIPRGKPRKLRENLNDMEIMAVATDVHQSKSNPQRFPLTYGKILFKDKSVFYYPKGELEDLIADVEGLFNKVRLRVGQTPPTKPKTIAQREELQDVGAYVLETEDLSTPEEFFLRRRRLRQEQQPGNQQAPGNRRTPGTRQAPGNRRTPGNGQAPPSTDPPLTDQAGLNEKTVYGDMPQNVCNHSPS